MTRLELKSMAPCYIVAKIQKKTGLFYENFTNILINNPSNGRCMAYSMILKLPQQRVAVFLRNRNQQSSGSLSIV